MTTKMSTPSSTNHKSKKQKRDHGKGSEVIVSLHFEFSFSIVIRRPSAMNSQWLHRMVTILIESPTSKWDGIVSWSQSIYWNWNEKRCNSLTVEFFSSASYPWNECILDDVKADDGIPDPEFTQLEYLNLTTHSDAFGVDPVPISWGHPDPNVRGPVICTVRHNSQRNAIGAHSGSYCVYTG